VMMRSAAERTLGTVCRSAPVSGRISDASAPRTPRSRRALIGRMDERRTLRTAPNHRRLLLSFRHRTITLTGSVRSIRKAGIADGQGGCRLRHG
jgi:hypothetical protein